MRCHDIMMKLPATLAALLLIAPAAALADLPSLKVVVSGANPPTGSIEISIFNSEESFMADPILQQSGEVAEDGRYEAEFFAVAEGEYAIVVVHDENDNGKLDTGFLGFGGEAIAYSNGADPWLGRPAYSDVAISVQADDVTEEISLD